MATPRRKPKSKPTAQLFDLKPALSAKRRREEEAKLAPRPFNLPRTTGSPFILPLAAFTGACFATGFLCGFWAGYWWRG